MKIAAHNRNYDLIPTFPCCWQSDWYYHVISLTNAAAAAGRLAAPTPPLLLVVQGNEVIFCSYIAISLLVCSWLKSGQIVSVQRHLVPFNQLQLAFLSAEGSIIQTRQEKIPHYNTHKHTHTRGKKKCVAHVCGLLPQKHQGSNYGTFTLVPKRSGLESMHRTGNLTCGQFQSGCNQAVSQHVDINMSRVVLKAQKTGFFS